MKYLRATFKNYIGFYNGMNLDTVDIDFSKSTNRIVLISGKNGAGKSSLLVHLNPFPDSSTSFIPEKTAEKNLVLTNGTDIYSIQIISPADIKGRKTTKAYIQKNGIELNENGNVSSYKDIIFSEFELDSNYLSLSRLSSTDRGLGDKTPAERKKFTANIIDNLEVYNTMYKTLNKKSLIYKSHIGTLHTKIQNIGSKEALDQRLVSLQSKESDLNARIMANNNQIVAIQAKNSIDEEEARAIQEATSLAESLKAELDLLESTLDLYYNKTKIKKDSIESKYTSDKSLIEKYQIKLSEISNQWKDKSNRLTEVSNNIRSIEAEIENTDTKDDISDRYNNSTQLINDLSAQLKELNIPNDPELILPITNLISFCEKFIALIDHFNDNISGADIEYILKTLSNKHTEELLAQQNELITKIDDNKNKIADIQGQMKILATLESRPSNCKIDSCPFISDAIKLKKSLKIDLIEELSALQDENLKLSEDITKIQSEIDYGASLRSKDMELRIITNMILENETGLSIFYPNFMANLDDSLISMSTFGDIRDHSRLTDGLNLLKLLDSEIQSNKVLEAEYKGYREKIQLLNSSRSMLESLKSEQNTLIDVVAELKSQITEYNNTINSINENMDIEDKYYNTYIGYSSKLNEYKIANQKVEEYQHKSAKALEALSSINGLRAEIESLSAELNPIMQDINTISGQLTLLDSYYIEYNEYKKSYDIIETLKKYCSPTGGGIQTLFMQIYMSKTKDVANEILAMLFNGGYQLLDFVINENEFRIPFIGDGLPVDDISSGSSSQISMMSLIINLVLLHQGSTTFNIAQLDECDAGLDSYNRSQFVNVLFHSMNILNIEQLFIISHSMELDNTFADIIQLQGYDNYESSIQSGNIIWSYYDQFKQ